MRHNAYFMPLALVSAMAIVQTAHAETFQVSDIRIDGLVRLTPASVYSVLPVSSGDQVDDTAIAASVRALYESGNFDDVQANRQGNVLTFKVVERPVIAKVELDGNKLIPAEALNEGLKKMGLAEGEVLKKSVLQNVENELEQQYTQQGRYNADVQVQTVARPNNRVDLKLLFNEGDAAKVVNINVIGNTVFKDSDIERAFAVKESSWSSILTRNDRYAKERMTASLEALRAMYLNDGYINFEVLNSQLNISEDKKRIFIEVSIDEGEQFKFGETKFLGDALYSESDLKALQLYKSGETYSQARVNTLKQLLTRKFGNAGYYYAEVNVVPEINEETKTVDLNYYINPGQQITVRRINFTGNNKTADEVLRRELRQMEGALASNEKIDLSKVRLERTGFFETVEITPARVPNAPDQVDLNVAVKEQHSGTSTIAVGYSESGGVTYQLGLSQTNFMGTGNRVSIDLSRSETLDYYNLNIYDPYFTIDGISRGYNVYYRKTKLDEDYNVSNYVTDSIGGSLTFGYPLDENQNISATLNVDKTKVTTGAYVSTYVRDYLLENGGKATGTSQYCTDDYELNDEGEYECTGIIETYDSEFQGEFLTYNLNLSWAYNTLNRPVFPTKGIYHRLSVDAALPGSDVEYQKATYDTQAYLPLWDSGFVLRGYGKLGYGHDLPFYKNFFAGGYGSVRGFDTNTLGPQYDSVIYEQTNTSDPDPEEVGGNALIQGGMELVLPMPTKSDWARQIRPVMFIEGGQVFDTESDEYDVDFNEMRYSAGVGFTWITMIGPLSLSYAYPLNDKKGDDTKSIQFEIGRTF
ncbi:outer membrane protein assembly factor BamA [Acinetobacter sp. A3.8]|uniref:Outer membrane protein assembly factor BamA n=1 Tax=Acinetobacter sedimenti TaxID=2919922 RepID=A0A9X1X0S8_9GAMM|nr:outer membrane protein assembly factor BamA [Acinetobacter sedimenti]MCJ8146960.1 outer membrane protein assembly factor BamA [Acinetobacter sedimenti]